MNAKITALVEIHNKERLRTRLTKSDVVDLDIFLAVMAQVWVSNRRQKLNSLQARLETKVHSQGSAITCEDFLQVLQQNTFKLLVLQPEEARSVYSRALSVVTSELTRTYGLDALLPYSGADESNNALTTLAMQGIDLQQKIRSVGASNHNSSHEKRHSKFAGPSASRIPTYQWNQMMVDAIMKEVWHSSRRARLLQYHIAYPHQVQESSKSKVDQGKDGECGWCWCRKSHLIEKKTEIGPKTSKIRTAAEGLLARLTVTADSRDASKDSSAAHSKTTEPSQESLMELDRMNSEKQENESNFMHHSKNTKTTRPLSAHSSQSSIHESRKKQPISKLQKSREVSVSKQPMDNISKFYFNFI